LLLCLTCCNVVFLRILFREEVLPEIIVKIFIEERPIHIAKDGVYVIPGQERVIFIVMHYWLSYAGFDDSATHNHIIIIKHYRLAGCDGALGFFEEDFDTPFSNRNYHCLYSF